MAGPRGVYLDHNATAPARPEAAAAMAEALAMGGNASSVHGFGRAARRRIEAAREAVARLVRADPAGLVFTSGGTEANNLVLRGRDWRRVLVSAGEHPSILAPRPDAVQVALRPDGRIDLTDLEAKLADQADNEAGSVLVSVMWANNETGVLQPLEDVVRIARAKGALVHCDAVQAAGKLPLDMTASGVDFLSLSAHKFGGPQGVGALLLAPGRELDAILLGGGQERRRRAGTENLPGIAGFGAAASRALDDLPAFERLSVLRDRLEEELLALAPEAVVFGEAAPRLPNTSCVAIPGLKAETQVMALDLAGVAVGAGSACSSGKVEPSHVLSAMGADPALAGAAIRISLGWNSQPDDVTEFLDAWRQFYRRGRAA